MSFQRRLELAPIGLIWVFVIFPIMIVLLADAGVILWLFVTGIGCLTFAVRQHRSHS